MIPATKLHDDLIRKLNRVDTNYSDTLDVMTRDNILNEAIERWYSSRAQYFDMSKRVKNMLDQLEVEREELDVSIHRNDSRAVVAEVPSDYYQETELQALAYKEPCGKRELIARPVQVDDKEQALRSPFWSPSYEFEDTIYHQANRKLIVYYKSSTQEEGDFKIEKIYLSYLRKPRKVYAPSLTESGEYVDSSGQRRTKDQGFEIDSTFEASIITDLATVIATRDLGELQDFQSQVQKILRIEQLYT